MTFISFVNVSMVLSYAFDAKKRSYFSCLVPVDTIVISSTFILSKDSVVSERQVQGCNELLLAASGISGRKISRGQVRAGWKWVMQ